jgi:hypothetical protein
VWEKGGRRSARGGLALAQRGVDAFCPLLDPLVRRRAHGLVLHHLAARVLNGGYEGVDPVVVPVLAAVLDRAHPALPLSQVGPHVGEGLGRHVGVAYQVVRRALQLR